MTTKTVAEERLLDLALEEVLAAQPAASRPRPSLVAAALFLSGVAVVATLLWHSASAPTSVQQPSPAPLPEPLPEPLRANSAAELAALPVSAVNIEARLAAPAEFAGLRRFRDLRRLRLLPPIVVPSLLSKEEVNQRYRADAAAATARFADAAAFAVLGELHTLEALHLPHQIPWTPEHFAFLRNLKLHDFSVEVVDLHSRAMIDALVAAPTFRTLRLSLARVGADLFRALQPLRLERLELWACAGLDDDAWAAIGKIRSLRALDVAHVREGTKQFGDESVAIGTCSDAAFAAFAALPDLSHLGLDECEFPGDLLARLPAQLTSLDLGHRRMTWGEARALRRLSALRSLTFGCGLDEQAAAEVLPSWSLERLDYRGQVFGIEVRPPLLDRIAAQPRLAELALHVTPLLTLLPLAQAPSLRVLELRGYSDDGFALAKLEPLAACEHLRMLRLRDSKLEERAVRELFGDHVAIEIITTTF